MVRWGHVGSAHPLLVQPASVAYYNLEGKEDSSCHPRALIFLFAPVGFGVLGPKP